MFNPQMWIWGYRDRYLPEDVAEDERREAALDRPSIEGFSVEALDGSIGHVEEALDDEQRGRIVVDTGPWIFGTKVVLPAGVVDRVDVLDEKVYVHRTKDEIRSAPPYVDDAGHEDYLRQVGDHYDEGGAGYRPMEERLPWR